MFATFLGLYTFYIFVNGYLFSILVNIPEDKEAYGEMYKIEEKEPGFFDNLNLDFDGDAYRGEAATVGDFKRAIEDGKVSYRALREVEDPDTGLVHSIRYPVKAIFTKPFWYTLAVFTFCTVCMCMDYLMKFMQLPLSKKEIMDMSAWAFAGWFFSGGCLAFMSFIMFQRNWSLLRSAKMRPATSVDHGFFEFCFGFFITAFPIIPFLFVVWPLMVDSHARKMGAKGVPAHWPLALILLVPAIYLVWWFYPGASMYYAHTRAFFIFPHVSAFLIIFALLAKRIEKNTIYFGGPEADVLDDRRVMRSMRKHFHKPFAHTFFDVNDEPKGKRFFMAIGGYPAKRRKL